MLVLLIQRTVCRYTRVPHDFVFCSEHTASALLESALEGLFSVRRSVCLLQSAPSRAIPAPVEKRGGSGPEQCILSWSPPPLPFRGWSREASSVPPPTALDDRIGSAHSRLTLAKQVAPQKQKLPPANPIHTGSRSASSDTTANTCERACRTAYCSASVCTYVLLDATF